MGKTAGNVLPRRSESSRILVLVLPVVPDILHIVVVFEHLEHLGHVLDVALVGQGNVALRNHFDLGGEKMILGAERFGHGRHIVRLSVDSENALFCLQIVGAGIQGCLENGVLIQISVFVVDDNDALFELRTGRIPRR